MYTCGWCRSHSYSEVVPDFGAPTRNRFGSVTSGSSGSDGRAGTGRFDLVGRGLERGARRVRRRAAGWSLRPAREVDAEQVLEPSHVRRVVAVVEAQADVG